MDDQKMNGGEGSVGPVIATIIILAVIVSLDSPTPSSNIASSCSTSGACSSKAKAPASPIEIPSRAAS